MAESYDFIKKETEAQGFYCEFCEISKNTFSYRTIPVAASMLSFRSSEGRLFFENLQAYLHHVKIKPIFSKFSHSLLQMSSFLGPFLRKF